MDCNHVAGMLPWYVNKTLDTQERAEVDRHLERCSDCRRELADTLTAMTALATHPPAERLVALAFDDPANTPAEVRQHLAACDDCRDLVSLARQSRDLERGTEDGGGFGRRHAALRGLGRLAWPMAAVLVLGFVFLGLAAWRWLGGEQGGAGSGLANARSHEVLEMALLEARQPQLNVETRELFPAERVSRSPSEMTAPNPLPLASRAVTLVLYVDDTRGFPGYGLLVRDDYRLTVWQGTGLVQQRGGEFTLSFPAGFLAPGRYELAILGMAGPGGEEVAVYRVEVE